MTTFEDAENLSIRSATPVDDNDVDDVKDDKSSIDLTDSKEIDAGENTNSFDIKNQDQEADEISEKAEIISENY